MSRKGGEHSMNEQKKEPTQQVEAAEPVSAMPDLREVPFSEVKRNLPRIMSIFLEDRSVRYDNTPSKS